MQGILLLLALIERTVALAPEVLELIERIRSGDEITPEDVERVERQVDAAVDRWRDAGGDPRP